MKKTGSVLLIFVLVMILIGQLPNNSVQAQTGITVDVANQTIENPYIKISWDTAVDERVSGLYLKDYDAAYNLVGSHPAEFTGTAYYYALPYGSGTPGLVGSASTNTTWDYSLNAEFVSVYIDSVSPGGVAVHTEYIVAANSPAIWVVRTFKFGSQSIDAALLAPYTLRAYDRGKFTTFAFPTITNTVSLVTGYCEDGCNYGNWNQTWIDIEAPSSGVGLGLVNLTGNPESTAWLDRDGDSATSYTYAALPGGTYNQDLAVSYVIYPHLGDYQTVDWAAISVPPPQISCEPLDLQGSQWNMRAINLVGALNQFTNCSPDPVKIAIIDTGADLNHSDLENNIFKTYSAVGLSAEDKIGHGTQVSGIIGAVQNNNFGIAGIHPNVQLLIYKYSDSRWWNSLYKDDYYRIADLIKQAIVDGAKVISISFSAESDRAVAVGGFVNRKFIPCLPHESGCIGVIGEAIREARNNNVVIVAASGNSMKDAYEYPAAYSAIFDNVIAVAASTKDNELAVYSTTGSWVNVSAPGGFKSYIPGRGKRACLSGIDDCVVSLGLDNTTDVEDEGTSLASPHVAGVVGLMISANPSLTPIQIREIISTEVTVWTINPIRSAGLGILNAEAAVRSAMP